MKTSVRRIVYAIVAVVIVCAVIALLMQARRPAVRPEGARPSASTGGTQPGNDQSAGTTEGNEPAIADSLDDAIKKSDTMTVEFRGKQIEGSQSKMEILKALVEASRNSILQKRARVFETIEPYFVAGERLRAQAREKYGQLNPEDIAKAVEAAEALEENFWQEGDYDNPDSFKDIYEARAILEVALEQYPDDENLLKAMIDVHMSGWPVNAASDKDDPLYMTGISRSIEIDQYLWRLWNSHISKKNPAALSYEDLAYCFDLSMYGTRATPDAIKELKEYMANPGNNVPAGFAAYFQALSEQPRITAADRLKPVDMALSRCKGEDGEWWRYRSVFEGQRQSLAEQGYSKWRPFPLLVDTYYYGNAEREETFEEDKYTLWRGSSFGGPGDRRKRLVPLVVYNSGDVVPGKGK